MKQSTFAVHNENEVYELIENVGLINAYQKARSTLLKIFVSSVSKVRVDQLLQVCRQSMPGIKTAGLSQDDSEENGTEDLVRLSFSFFEESEVDTRSYNLKETAIPDMIEDVRLYIESLEDVRHVELFFSGRSIPVSMITEKISAGMQDISFSGAIAGVYNREDTFVLGDQIYPEGLTVIVYSGKTLEVLVDKRAGWRPVSRVFRASAEEISGGVVGDTCLTHLGGSPAAQVYRDYLGLGEEYALVPNIGEFPIILNRDGEECLRVPLAAGDEGQLYCYGDIRSDEEVRLGYGCAESLEKEAERGGDAVEAFCPEAVNLYICSARSAIMGRRNGREINNYLRSCLTLSYAYTRSAITVLNGKGGLSGGALLCIAFREGEKNTKRKLALLHDPSSEVVSKVKPLDERMFSFLSRTMNELQDMAIEANSANIAKSQFLSNMSHEIRTPINIVLGMDEIILRESDSPEIRRLASNIKVAGTMLQSLVNGILDFSRIESGHMELNVAEFDAREMIRDFVVLAKAHSRNAEVSFRSQIDSEIPRLLCGDISKIRQCVLNLISNADKYTEKGEVVLAVQLLEKQQDSCRVRFMVTDTGTGIREEDISRLTTAFERLEAQNSSIEGTGLGLSITVRLLELMSSELKVESIYGKGSKFYFDLQMPYKEGDGIGDSPTIEAITEAHTTTLNLKNVHILAVDDAPLNLEVIRGLLEPTGIQMDSAENGKTCLRLAKERAYDLILLDHRMPEMDGVEVLKRLREPGAMKTPGIPVICLTANAVGNVRQEYINIGFTDYLAKPVQVSSLEEMLRRYIGKEKVIEKTAAEETVHRQEMSGEQASAALPGELLGIPGLYPDAGIQYCGNIPNYLGALKLYVAGIPETAEKMKAALGSDDYQQFGLLAHSVKSTSKAVGVMEISGFSAAMEEAANNLNYGVLKMHGHVLVEKYIDMGKQLTAYFAEQDTDKTEKSEGAEISAEELRDAWETMLELSVHYDYDSIQDVLGALKEYSYPVWAEKKIKAVEEAAGKPDWEVLKQLLTEPW